MVEAIQSERLHADDFEISTVPFDAPWSWLGAGWRDLTETPMLSLGYGLVFTVISAILLYGLTHVGWETMTLALCGGFLILGPLFAVGLYEISRLHAAGETPTLDKIIHTSLSSPGHLAFMGFILLFIFSAWLRIAFLLFAIFFGGVSLPAPEQFVPELLFTSHGLGLLIVGTIVGAALALVAYTVSVVAIPLLMRHRVDVFTAITVSMQAVAKNPKPMLLWALLIAAIMACGIASALLGLIVAFPLVGHATWHAYDELVQSGVAEGA